MAGVSGRSGSVKRIIFSRVVRVSLGPGDTDLLPFFERLEELPPGKRNAALVAAIRGGAAGAEKVMMAEDDELADSAGEFLV